MSGRYLFGEGQLLWVFQGTMQLDDRNTLSPFFWPLLMTEEKLQRIVRQLHEQTSTSTMQTIAFEPFSSMGD